MAFLQFHDVGNHTTIFAVGELINLCAAGFRIVSPAVSARILARRIPHIARFWVEDFGQLNEDYVWLREYALPRKGAANG